MKTNNLKKINEYKRILRKLLDDEGLRGVSLRGTSYSFSGSVDVMARVALDIRISFDGQKATVRNGETGSITELSLADPTSIDTLKKLFSNDVQRILNGPKNA
jgi:hypothetical protein